MFPSSLPVVVRPLTTFAALGFLLLTPAVSWANPTLPAPPAGSAMSPRVELIDPGTGRKAELRFRPKHGAKASIELVTSIQMSMDLFGVTIPQELPTTRMVLETRVAAVEPNGDFRYTFRVTEAGNAPGGSASSGANPDLEATVNTTGEVIVTDRGVTTSFRAEPPPGVPTNSFTQASQGLDLASAPFPDEPVGVGASWRVLQDVTNDGITVNQSTVFTLESRKGNKVVLRTAVSQTAAPHDLSLPDLPPGSSASLDGVTGGGAGLIALDLRRVLPTSARVDVTTEIRMTMQALGEEQSTRAVMELSLTLDQP